MKVGLGRCLLSLDDTRRSPVGVSRRLLREKLDVVLATLPRRSLVDEVRRAALSGRTLLKRAESRRVDLEKESCFPSSSPDVDLESDDALDVEPNEKACGTVAAMDETRTRGVPVPRGVASGVTLDPDDFFRGVTKSGIGGGIIGRRTDEGRDDEG